MQKKPLEKLPPFGRRLRQLREERNISQKDMITKVNEYFGYNRFATVQAYNRYEIFGAQPDIEMLKCFSNILKVSADELIGNDSFTSQTPLQQALMIARKNGYEVTDKGNGIVEMVEDSKEDRLEVIFSYDDFIDVVKNVENQAQDAYIEEFVRGFDTGYLLQVYAHVFPENVTYTPKTKLAYDYRPEWIQFTEYKKEREKQRDETAKYVRDLLERVKHGDQQAITEYEDIFNRIDELQTQYEKKKKEIEDEIEKHTENLIYKKDGDH